MEEDQFKDKTTEWRGYTLRALEDINKELSEVKEEISLCNDKIDRLSSRLTGLEIKMAGIGATSGLITSLVLWVITKI